MIWEFFFAIHATANDHRYRGSLSDYGGRKSKYCVYRNHTAVNFLTTASNPDLYLTCVKYWRLVPPYGWHRLQVSSATDPTLLDILNILVCFSRTAFGLSPSEISLDCVEYRFILFILKYHPSLSLVVFTLHPCIIFLPPVH